MTIVGSSDPSVRAREFMAAFELEYAPQPATPFVAAPDETRMILPVSFASWFDLTRLRDGRAWAIIEMREKKLVSNSCLYSWSRAAGVTIEAVVPSGESVAALTGELKSQG